jgi:hypothetical protein
VLVSRQMPLQFVRPPPQLTWQVPLEQSWPAAHARPHAPQLLGSVAKSRQMPLQFVRPLPQLT